MRERRREPDAIAILALALIAMMFWIPAAQGTRDLFTGRMQPFVFLILPAWFTPRLAGPLARPRCWRCSRCIAIANAAIAFERVRFFGRDDAGDWCAPSTAIEPGTTHASAALRASALAFVRERVRAFHELRRARQTAGRSLELRAVHEFLSDRRSRARVSGSYVIENAPGTIDLSQPDRARRLRRHTSLARGRAESRRPAHALSPDRRDRRLSDLSPPVATRRALRADPAPPPRHARSHALDDRSDAAQSRLAADARRAPCHLSDRSLVRPRARTG